MSILLKYKINYSKYRVEFYSELPDFVEYISTKFIYLINLIMYHIQLR